MKSSLSTNYRHFNSTNKHYATIRRKTSWVPVNLLHFLVIMARVLKIRVKLTNMYYNSLVVVKYLLTNFRIACWKTDICKSRFKTILLSLQKWYLRNPKRILSINIKLLKTEFPRNYTSTNADHKIASITNNSTHNNTMFSNAITS